MKKNSNDSKITELLSSYIDQLNTGTALSLDKIVSIHGEIGSSVRDIIETLLPLKGGTLFKPLSDERKNAIFARLRRELDIPVTSAQATTDPLPITQRTDILILLLNFMSQIWGDTKLVKLLFLLAQEGDCNKFVPDFYMATANNYGPFDKNILDDINILHQRGIIEKRTIIPRQNRSANGDLGVPNTKQVNAVYKLTHEGKQCAERLLKGASAKNPEIVKKIKEIVDKYGKKTSDELLSYIYNKYPKTTTKSLVRDKYLKPKNTNSSTKDRDSYNE